MTEAHDIGDQRRIHGSFTDLAGDAADPSNIDLTIREPDGTVVAKVKADCSTTGTGAWYYDFTVTKQGRHYVRWAGSGDLVAAGNHEFWARHVKAA